MNTMLQHIAGKTFKVNDKFTRKAAAIEVLMAITSSRGRDCWGEPKLKRYEIAVKVKIAGEVELTTQEPALLKQRIGMIYGPAVVGPAYKLLNE